MNLTKGHNNLTKLNEKTSCICESLFELVTHLALDGNFISPRNFYFIFIFLKEILRILSITQEKIIATLI